MEVPGSFVTGRIPLKTEAPSTPVKDFAVTAADIDGEHLHIRVDSASFPPFWMTIMLPVEYFAKLLKERETVAI